MKKYFLTTILSITMIAIAGPAFSQVFGGDKQKHTASYYNYSTECLGDKLDGSYIFRAWGVGSTKKEAIDQAKRNVLNDILFNGITKGQCRVNRLIVEINAKEKYRNYVYNFFNSEYDDYIKIQKSPKSRKKSRQQTVYGIKVRVKVEAMRQKLRADNIINY